MTKLPYICRSIYFFMSFKGSLVVNIWYCGMIWLVVTLVIVGTFVLGCYKHKASESDKANYIQLLRDTATLRVLEQCK